MICAGDVPGVDAGVVWGPDHAGPLRAPVQLVVTLSVGHQTAPELRQPCRVLSGEENILFRLAQQTGI